VAIPGSKCTTRLGEFIAIGLGHSPPVFFLLDGISKIYPTTMSLKMGGE